MVQCKSFRAVTCSPLCAKQKSKNQSSQKAGFTTGERRSPGLLSRNSHPDTNNGQCFVLPAFLRMT